MEFGLFSGSGLLLSNLGENTIASHAIAMQVTTVTVMLPLSIGLAAAVRSGNLLGAGEFIRARFSSFFAIIIAVTLRLFLTSYYCITLEHFLLLFQHRSRCHYTIWFSDLYCSIYANFRWHSFTGQGALRGYKDTLAPLYIMIIAFGALDYQSDMYWVSQTYYYQAKELRECGLAYVLACY